MYAVTAWMVRLYVHTRGNHMDKFKKETIKLTTKASGQEGKPSLTGSANNGAEKSAPLSKGAPAVPSTVVPHAPNTVPGAPVDPKSTVPHASGIGNSRKRNRDYASRRSVSELKAARRYLDRLGSKPKESLTAGETSQLSWARSRLAAEAASPGVAQTTRPAGTKRQRSGETVSPQTAQPSKKPKKVINRPYSDVAKDTLVRAIVDESNSDGSITHEKWELIGQKLLITFLEDTGGVYNPPPQCTDAGWFQGHVKLVKCADERSVRMLTQIIPSLGEVWPGARLKLVSVGEIPRRPRAVAAIPAEPHDPESILGIFRRANPNLPTHDWKVVKVFHSVGARRKVVVVLNKETLSLLRDTNGLVYYGFLGIRLNVYRGDDKPDHDGTEKKVGDTKEPIGPSTSKGVSSAAESTTSGCSQTTLVGDLLGKLDFGDEEALLEAEDAESLNYDPDEDGEGDSN